MGGVEEENPLRFFAVRVVDRTAETMREVIKRHIVPRTEILTDGHRSYPAALRSLESLVSAPKTSLKRMADTLIKLKPFVASQVNRKRGVKMIEIDDFLVEFRFCRRYAKEILFCFS